MTTTEADRPVAEGLFEVSDGVPRLIGSHCLSCDALYFPRALSCRNPDCLEKNVERRLLADRGTLYSFTIQRYRPPPLFRMDDWTPFALGLVDLGCGLRVMGMLTGIPLDQIQIGLPVKLVVETLFRSVDRVNVVTYKFAPQTGGVGA